ncbi:unnamed protein product [Oikopleura dioica]|uniref:Uncharacterized protein n=1 Tax=Oikopleura dioica TaxID=34765 RepID=E4WQ11_OIKDI|nr:unnamed protein product [Oikopleura dioica]
MIKEFVLAYKSSLVVILAPLLFMPLLFTKETDALGQDLYCELFGEPACSAAFDKSYIGEPPPQPVLFKCAYVVAVMVVFWCFEAAPLSATKICASYFKDVVVLFVGGLTLAISIEVWNLHKRIALYVLTKVGSKPSFLLAGFMATTSFISMWMSNVATTAMMVPIAKAVLDQLEDVIESETSKESTAEQEESSKLIQHEEKLIITSSEEKKIKKRMLLGLCKALMLGIAYCASIGGVGMLTGTGPNLIAAQAADDRYKFSINFVNWASFATPLSILMTLITWVVLVFVFLRDSESHKVDEEQQAKETEKIIKNQYGALGDVTFAEKMIMNCFILLLGLWLTRAPSGAGSGWSQLFKAGFPSDASAALFVAFLLFILPAEKPFQRDENGKFIISKPLITWKQMSSKMSWGVIFLLGGGFAMASGITSSGLGKFVGLKMQALKGLPSYLMVLICCITINLMSQVTSNSSTMTIFASILCDMAENLNINPMFILIPSTAAVSFAFSLPVSTPPNAVVFEYGYVSMLDMVKVGLPLSLIGAFLSSVAILIFGGMQSTFDAYNSCPQYLVEGDASTQYCIESHQYGNISVST